MLFACALKEFFPPLWQKYPKICLATDTEVDSVFNGAGRGIRNEIR